MSRSATISLVSFPTLPPDEPDRFEKTLAKMATCVDEAAQSKSELVAFPETCNYLHSGPTYLEAEPLDGPTVTAIAKKAKAHGIHVICPLVTDHDGVRYNSSVLIGRDGGVQGIYHKNFLTFEELNAGIMPGTETPVFETDFGRVGICICFDMFFGEVWRGLSANRAELVVWSSMPPGGRWPSRWPMEFGFHIATVSSNRCAFVDVAGREILMTRRNLHDSTQGAVSPLTTATLELGRRLFCHDFNVPKVRDLCKKYGSTSIFAEWMQGECLIVLDSLMPDISTDELIEEFEMETMPDYLDRARIAREQMLAGKYEA